MSIIKLQPGMFVQLRTKVEGGVKYQRVDLDAHDEGEAAVAEWKTTRRTDNAVEFKEAGRIRSKARALVEKVCIKTPFTLICPPEEEARFDARMDEAQAMLAEFNGRAHYSRIKLAFICGQMADSKASSIASIREEISHLLEDMERVSREGDAVSIRTVATRATEMSRLLEQKSEARGVLAKAIKTARGIATQIVKRVEKNGEELAAVLEGIQLSPIAQARFAFLGEEAEDGHEVAEERDAEIEEAEPELPALPLGRFAGTAPFPGEEEDEEGDPFGFGEDPETALLSDPTEEALLAGGGPMALGIDIDSAEEAAAGEVTDTAD